MNNHQYHQKAKEQYEGDGKIEIFEKPVVSPIEEENGAYVLAWVWVSDDKPKEQFINLGIQDFMKPPGA